MVHDRGFCYENKDGKILSKKLKRSKELISLGNLNFPQVKKEEELFFFAMKVYM